MPVLEVKIHSLKNIYAFGEPLVLHYEAKNVCRSDLFIIKDRVYPIRESGNMLKIRLGEIEPTIPFDYFDYHPPTLQKLSPGDSVSSELQIGLPPQASELDDKDMMYHEMVELSGEIGVELVVGYGKTAFRAKSLDTFGEFLDWQQLATSNRIAAYIHAS